MPDYSLEMMNEGLVAGVDEVGRGPLAGPVVAATVVFLEPPSGALSALIDDSKKLTARRRERAFQALQKSDELVFAVGSASVSEIETLNISNACHLAMVRSLERVSKHLGRWPDLALIDGNRAPQIPCSVKTVVKGDSISVSIAAASIIAKVVRDRLMARLSLRYPAYAWERNAGYGTVAHLKGLEEEGVTLHHRRGFAPIRHMIAEEVHAA